MIKKVLELKKKNVKELLKEKNLNIEKLLLKIDLIK